MSSPSFNFALRDVRLLIAPAESLHYNLPAFRQVSEGTSRNKFKGLPVLSFHPLWQAPPEVENCHTEENIFLP
ncbi:MAG: hypothetical protein JMDDDDMK_02299 [Acidobacteria bacterium]|nr:hypothetical protein [Acidobacteriota bacterium]